MGLPTRFPVRMIGLLTAATLCGGALRAQAPEGAPGSDRAVQGKSEQPSPFRAFDRAAFERHVRMKLGGDDAKLATFASELSDGVAMARAADALLRAVHAGYDGAVRSAEDGDPKAALTLTKLLTSTVDPYLRGHTRYHLGRVFLDADDPDKAIEIFSDYLQQDRNVGAVTAEVLYFYAQSLAEVPLPDEAIHAFRKFLDYFPESPERFRASATQQIATLEAQLDNPLHSLADSMKDVQRRIRKTDTGKPTQEKQEAIIAELAEIIEIMEEQEKQSSGAAGGLNNPTAPAGQSQVAPGATRIGNLRRNTGVADRWGDLEDREREKIEADLQTKLSGRYRGLLQDYYKKLGSGSSTQRNGGARRNGGSGRSGGGR